MTRHRSGIYVVLLMLSIGLGTPATLRAQDQKLSRIVVNQYVESAGTAAGLISGAFGIPLDVTVGAVLSQFQPQLDFSVALNTLVGSQVSSFPLGSSAGGFSWTFDPALGTFNRVSPSFGPVFADRALTTGRRRLNFGANYQRATFDSIEGVDLDSRAITSYLQFPIQTSTTPSRVVTFTFEDALNLKLTTDTVGLFFTYGVTDRLDIGAAIPIQHVTMETSLRTRIGAVSGSGGFGEEFDRTEGTPVSGSASGIGDIVVRGKYLFFKTAGGGIAGAVDVRLPTGDEENFLGIAGSQTKFQVIGSTAYGRLSPHVNVGYTVSGESAAAKDPDTFVFAPPNEFNFAGGADVAVSQRLTLVGDILSRSLHDTTRLSLVPTSFDPSLRQFASSTGNLNSVLGSVGAKFSLRGRGLVSFNVLFPLNDAGLVDNLTWVGGAEISF
jgi:hypothetical protein